MSMLIILIAAWGAGGLWRGRAPVEDWLEGCCAQLLAGLAMVAPLVLLLGSISLSWAQYALWGLALFTVAASLRRGATVARGRVSLSGLNRLEWVAVVATGFAWLLTLVSALAPATGWDAAVAHLALPSDYAREGRIFLHPGNVYAGYPHFMHGLYAVAFYNGAGGHEVLVSLLNWTMGVLACVSVYVLGRRIGTRQTGLVAAAILATAPIFMDQAGNVGIDLPFTAFSTAAVAALVAWHDERKTAWLILAAMLAGASCGIRHTGFLVSLLLGIGVIGLGLRSAGLRLAGLKPALVFGGVGLLAAAPWFLRTWYLVGNPVFPFLLGWFPEAPIDHIAISAPGSHESIGRSSGIGVLAFLRFPWDIIMRPQLYDGWNKSPGGLVLVLGIPGLLLGGWRAWSLGAFSAAGGVAFFFFQRLARYLLPFFAPMMVVAALPVERLARGRRVVVVILLFAFLYGLALHAAAMHFKVRVVLGLESKPAYLASRVERYAAFQYANTHLNDGGTLLTVDQRSYYIDGPTYQNHWSLKKIAVLSLREQVAWLHEHEIRYLMIPRDFVAGSGALSGDVAAMLANWERQPRWFKLLEPPLELPRRHGDGLEEVAFYAVQ